MNRVEIETDHWIERYLAGRLSETEARRFEAYWIENPGLVRDLERTAQLQSGLAGLRARGELDGLMRSSWWSGSLRLLALAASVAVVAIGAALWNGARDSDGAMLGSAPTALAALQGAMLPRGDVYPILRLRSATSRDAIVTLPATPQAIALRILPEVDPGVDPDIGLGVDPGDAEDRADRGAPSRYAVVLEREGATGSSPAAARVEALAADADGFVTVFADSRQLEPGRYRLRLEPAGDASGVARFVIDVRSGATAQ